MIYTPPNEKKIILNSLMNVPDTMMTFLVRNKMIRETHQGKATVADASMLLNAGMTINQILSA